MNYHFNIRIYLQVTVYNKNKSVEFPDYVLWLNRVIAAKYLNINCSNSIYRIYLKKLTLKSKISKSTVFYNDFFITYDTVVPLTRSSLRYFYIKTPITRCLDSFVDSPQSFIFFCFFHIPKFRIQKC